MIGIFGGTFDPIHCGHLYSAIELCDALALDELRLVPCHLPAHREAPGCSSAARCDMVALAVAADPRLRVDARELQRPGPSYTVDTLLDLRRELGAVQPLCLVLGSDAFAGLDRWHRWRELLDLAHLVVMARAGEAPPTSGAAAELLAQRQVADAAFLRAQPAGAILWQTLTPWPISATAIREALAAGGEQTLAVAAQLPPPVWDYIQQHALYRH